jgi:small GTP-binding protein
MNNTFNYDVFLSYSSQDKQVVHALAERLKQEGLRVWLDAWAIQPGDAISLKIQHGLEQSRTLLMCMSRAYFDSEWATLEHHTLLFRDPTNAHRRFIPLLIEDCTMPDIIAQFKYIDWRARSGEAYETLLASCRGGGADTTGVLARDEHVDQSRMVLRGPTCSVVGMAITPDGKTVVSGSYDNTLRVWDLETGQCRATFEGHTGAVRGIAVTPDGKTVVSGSDDNTLKVWNIESGKCLATFGGHQGVIGGVAITPDGKTVVSGSIDRTLVWDIESNECLASFNVDFSLAAVPAMFAITPDGKKVVSGMYDKCVNVWNLESGHHLRAFKGHQEAIGGVTITPDGRTVVSGSDDQTLKVWDLETGQCRATFEGHTGAVRGIAVTPDGKTVVSGSSDNTLRVWELPQPDTEIVDDSVAFTIKLVAARYTNAKVVLVGESGVGKTGLALRLAEDRWQETSSTHGMNVWQLNLPEVETDGMEREVWLWDFAGQPDYRLIHQLYMDETALALMVIDPQRDDPFEPLDHWEKALLVAVKHNPARLLVAARCDMGGLTISQSKVDRYQKEHGYSGFLNTAAKTGDGCADLKNLIAEHIPWERLPWTATSRLFKTLKDAIASRRRAARRTGGHPEARFWGFRAAPA